LLVGLAVNALKTQRSGVHRNTEGGTMRRLASFRNLCFALFLSVHALAPEGGAMAQSSLSPGYAAEDSKFSDSARVGRAIWFFATAFNDRFYTYSYPQRLGAAIDWYKILGAKNRRDLFQAWGAIPDPDCCVPGDPDCPAKSLDETYGFPWCPGDAELLKFVGKEKIDGKDYRDPACDLEDAPFQPEEHRKTDQRQDKCDLKFGTSTGALGLRKFPNPRFDAAKWEKLNGSRASWDGYRSFLSGDSGSGDSRTNRLFDGAVEPPFRIGMSCGACHISYKPDRPPTDPNKPEWASIDGLVGNQFSRVSQMLASGMSQHMLEWQLIARTRPGTVDTSALPMDTVANPGTMNLIVNFAKRPVHQHSVLKWRKASNCPEGANATCWCEPAKPGKCWERSEKSEPVQHILKGGEDSVGAAEAIQRVYFNIGSCAEQCWLNHVPDLRAIDPSQRNAGQTPFDIGQCRRDCASFRAIEDRLGNVVDFFLSARPTDLASARGITAQELDAQLDREFDAGSVALGQQVFAKTCAGCHSSQNGPFDGVDFRAVDPDDPGDKFDPSRPRLRKDFLSSERPIPASRVGTYVARAMHSNHMPSRIWDQYAARDLSQRPVDPALREVMKGSGRGYYRPPTLLSAWAYAPFMHNNAIGPEVCGKPSDPKLDFYSSPYVDRDGKPLANPPPCWPFDVSVEGRYRLFKTSMEDLLHPARRIPKLFITDEDVIVDIAPKTNIGGIEASLTVRLPKGLPAVMLNSLRYKDMIQDVVLNERDPGKLEAKYEEFLTVRQFRELKQGLANMRDMLRRPGNIQIDISRNDIKITPSQGLSDFIQNYYSNVLTQRVENGGHRFGEDLSEREKQALIAFLATL
jgi:hypothetical protein